eukprot:11873117-Karenia_brevis.AAC.1
MVMMVMIMMMMIFACLRRRCRSLPATPLATSARLALSQQLTSPCNHKAPRKILGRSSRVTTP